MKIEKDVDLGKKTTIGVGAIASYFVSINGKDDLVEVYKYAKENNLGLLPIGIGSNLFFYNDIKDKIVIQIKNNFVEKIGEDTFKVGAGVILQNLILDLSKKGFDLSCLSGYPSTIGGAICVNSGLLGKSIGDFLVSASLFNTDNGCFEEWLNKDFDFKYRYSNLKGKSGFVVYDAIFKFPKGEDIENKVKNLIQERTSKQPKGRSCGCFFKNPEGNAAGALIDSAGLKGFSIGGAYVSDVHANFLMTREGATKDDFFNLKEYVKNKVKEKHGITLEEEVVIC